MKGPIMKSIKKESALCLSWKSPFPSENSIDRVKAILYKGKVIVMKILLFKYIFD